MSESTSTSEEIARLLDLVNSLYAEIEERTAQLSAVHRVCVLSGDPLDVRLRKILAAAIEVVDGDLGSVQVHEPESDTLKFTCAVGSLEQSLVGQSLSVGEGINGQVFRSGVAHITNDVNTDADFNPEIDRCTGYQTRSLVTVPMRGSNGNVFGVVQVLNGRRPFTQHDVKMLEILAALTSQALELQAAQTAQ